jgi:transketolase
VWEASNFALDNDLDVIVVIDHNGWQGCRKVTHLRVPLPYVEIDGHDKCQLSHALTMGSGPRAIVCRTVKGKGVSFMEHDNEWHYRRLTDDDLALALEEVRSHE